MDYYLEPYMPTALKKIVDDIHNEGLHKYKSTDLSNNQLRIIYGHIARHTEDMEFVVMKYNEYYQQCTVSLN